MDLTDPIKVLDHGYVKLITKSGTDELIIESARMSTNKGFEGWEKDQKLLEYLYRNQHMSPFEMCDMTVEMKTPIFVAREIFRHRTCSYNELSGRYVQMPNEHYVPEKFRFVAQGKSNKQGSSNESLPEDVVEGMIANIVDEQESIYRGYEESLVEGLTREVARINTPVSRYTKFRMKSNLRNWLHFLDLRMRENAQWETRQFANAVASLVGTLWPKTYDLFLKYDLRALKLDSDQVSEIVNLIRDLHEFNPEFRTDQVSKILTSLRRG